MKEFNLLSIMFTKDGKSATMFNSNLKVGTIGPTNLYICPLNTSVTKKAKINHAITALEYIISNRVGFAEFANDKGVYVEFYDSSSPNQNAIYKAWFKHSNNTLYTDVSEPLTAAHSVLPLFLYAISTLSGMSYTRDAFLDCINEYVNTSTVSDGKLYYLSDCFYYECKAQFHGNDKMLWNDGLNLDVLKQSARTGNLKENPFAQVSNCATYFKTLSGVTLQSNSNTVTSDDTNKLKDCAAGKYLLDYCWELEQMPYIQDLSILDEFVPSKAFYTLVDLIHSELSAVNERVKNGELGVKAIKNNYVNSILVGKPGTGKTTLANALSATFGMPVRVVAASKNTDEDEFKGKTKVSDGGFKFIETKFLDAYKRGGIILLEEFNLADPGVIMGAIGQAIEKPFILDEDECREVRRHPFSVVIATMNAGAQGSREPSEAFTSRLPYVFTIDDPTEQDHIDRLVMEGFSKSDSKKMVKTYNKIIDYLESPLKNAEDVAFAITYRHCVAALKLMKCGRSFKEAVNDTIIGIIATKDIALAKDVYTNVVEPLVIV